MFCILCTESALKGYKYCAAHKARADKQTLAEKVAEQSFASIRAGDTVTDLQDTYIVQSIRHAKNGAPFELDSLTLKNTVTHGTRVWSCGGYFRQIRKVMGGAQ